MGKNIFGEKLQGEEYLDREAAYGLIFDEMGRIAIVKNPRNYFLPGGGIENSESPVECVIRECLEELGFSIKIKDFLCKGELYHHGVMLKHYLHSVGHFYIVESFEKVTEPIEEDHELLWMSLDEAIEKLCLEHQVWAVKEFIKQNN